MKWLVFSIPTHREPPTTCRSVKPARLRSKVPSLVSPPASPWGFHRRKWWDFAGFLDHRKCCDFANMSLFHVRCAQKSDEISANGFSPGTRRTGMGHQPFFGSPKILESSTIRIVTRMLTTVIYHYHCKMFLRYCGDKKGNHYQSLSYPMYSHPGLSFDKQQNCELGSKIATD